MTQEIELHKIKWMRSKAFKVEVKDQERGESAKTWATENVDERSWSFSLNPETKQYNFFFEHPQDATKLKEELYGDSRTIDIS
jgi:hypothetical protein